MGGICKKELNLHPKTGGICKKEVKLYPKMGGICKRGDIVPKNG
jgi:hypothetical protein